VNMKSLWYLSGLLMLGLVATGCGSYSSTSPSPASTVKFTAVLLPASEVPPVTGNPGGMARGQLTRVQ
jgi:hypothetical protein